MPLNESALPFFPAVVHVAPTSDPVCPKPVASTVVLPLPSLKAYAATSPAGRVTGVNVAV